MPGTLIQPGLKTPQQSNALDQLLSMGLQGIQNRKPFDFAPIEQQARSNFMTQTVPGLAERFTSMGSNLRSSGFQDALGRQASNLDQGLAALKAQYGMQQQGQQDQLFQNLLGIGLQPRFENIYQPEGPSFGTGIAGGLGQGLGMALPTLLSSLGGGALSGLGAGALGAGTAGLGSLLALLAYLSQGK